MREYTGHTRSESRFQTRVAKSLLAIAAFLVSGAFSCAQEQDVPSAEPTTVNDMLLSQLRELWKQRLNATSAMRYRLKGTITHASGSVVSPTEQRVAEGELPKVTPGYPREETTTPLEIEWLIDLNAGKFKKYSKDMSFNIKRGAFRPFVRKEVYDGNRLMGHWPRDENTSEIYTPEPDREDVIYWQESDLTLIANSNDLPIFLAHGLYGCKPQNLIEASLTDNPNLRIDGTTDHQGETAVILSEIPDPSNPFQKQVTYYAVPKWSGAIVRVESSRDGILFDTLEIVYSQSADGWMPSQWETVYYKGTKIAKNNTPDTTYTMMVDSLDLHPTVTAKDFLIDLQPGMIVARNDLGGEKQRVAPDGQTLQHYFPGSKAATGAGSVGLRVGLAIIVAVVAALSGFWALSKRRQ